MQDLIEIEFNFSENSIISGIDQDRYFFFHVYEKCITFSSSFRDMTYNYYLKQPMPMYEVRLTPILAKNPRLIYRLKRFRKNPYTIKYTNQEIIIVNEKNENFCHKNEK